MVKCNVVKCEVITRTKRPKLLSYCICHITPHCRKVGVKIMETNCLSRVHSPFAVIAALSQQN